MTPLPDPSFPSGDLSTSPAPVGTAKPPTVAPTDIFDDAIGLIEAGWTRSGARDGDGRACNALSPRPRRLALNAAVRRAAYDLGGRRFRDRLDPADTAGGALRSVDDRIREMLRKTLPADAPAMH